MVERRVKRELCSLVGRDGAQQIGAVGGLAEDSLERLFVFFDGCDPRPRRVQAGLAHLHGIDDRQSGLFLKRLRATVPELRLVIECVQNGWGVALACASFDTDRDGPPISEGAAGIMTRTAGHCPVCRQPAIEEQLLAEGDLLGGLRIVRWNRRASHGGRNANLSKRSGSGQRTGFGNGRRFPRGLLSDSFRSGFRRRIRVFPRAVAAQDQRSVHEQNKCGQQLYSHPTVLLIVASCLTVHNMFSSEVGSALDDCSRVTGYAEVTLLLDRLAG